MKLHKYFVQKKGEEKTNILILFIFIIEQIAFELVCMYMNPSKIELKSGTIQSFNAFIEIEHYTMHKSE